MLERLKFNINLVPRTKKNSQRIIVNRKTNRPMIIASNAYKEYEGAAGYFLKGKGMKIDHPVNVKAVYYMPNKRRVDLTNLNEALHDILVKYDVLEDDNYKIIASTDGSSVHVDRNNPRTEVTIEKIEVTE